MPSGGGALLVKQSRHGSNEQMTSMKSCIVISWGIVRKSRSDTLFF